ncbi:hypothetical protein K1719_000274 [Acacia pycnantha]|nr:hypothetical protein K1719_000274 [Acacia pycnantha]
MLAAMTNDIICQFEGHVTASAMWTTLKKEFDGTSKRNPFKVQQVQAIVSLLPTSWDHMKHTITRNNTIKTFADVVRHIQLEDDHTDGRKPNSQALLTKGKVASSQKRKPNKGKGHYKKKGNPRA